MNKLNPSDVIGQTASQCDSYIKSLVATLQTFDSTAIASLAAGIVRMKAAGGTLYICGNGGSAANAMHIANDFTFGVSPNGNAIKVEALPANSSVLTCLANDIGYENIFSHQLKIKGQAADMLLVLSGSGNSANILNAIAQAKQLGMYTAAILGYEGGKAKAMVDLPIHIAVMDMQIAEDTQLIIGHIIMQSLHSLLQHA